MNIQVDLSPIAGNSNQTLYDDGTNGDVTAGDGIYTYNNLRVIGQMVVTSGVVLSVTINDSANPDVVDNTGIVNIIKWL